MFVCAFFTCAGVVGYAWYPGDGVPMLGIFFITLTVNTYFSIRFYTELLPALTFIDRFIDAVLAVLYIGLAAALSSIFLFELIGLILFSVATAKYILLLTRGAYAATLRKKIGIDTLGTLLFALCLAVSLAGFETISAWALAVLFFVANVYLLLLNPMYRVATNDNLRDASGGDASRARQAPHQ